MVTIKNPRLALAGALIAAGSLLASGALPVSQTFAADPPHLVATGPSGTLAPGSDAVISGDVVGATGTPLYQFRIGNRILQKYSTSNHYELQDLAAGQYAVTVRSLGLAQDKRGQFGAFRSATVDLNVANTPHLTVQGPPNGVATNGDATITAQVVNALASGPYYQFVLNGTTVQAYSQNDSLSLTNLKPGSYQLLVESLGAGQFRAGAVSQARQDTITFTVPAPAVTPTVSVSVPDVAAGTADTLAVSGVPSTATISWSVVSGNTSTGLVSGTGDTATFIGTAPGTYTVQASVDGATATATVTVFGQAAGVSLTPASSSVIADGLSQDTITANVVDSAGNKVTDFNGIVDINAQSGVTYSQNGTNLPVVSGEVAVAITNGTTTFEVGKVSVPGLNIAMAASNLTSSNGQSVATQPSYASTTITSAPQVATGLKIVNAPTYLDANSQGATSPAMAVVVVDQAGYPMLTGTTSVNVTVAGSGTLINGTNNQETLAYDGFSAPSGSTNMSAEFEVASEQGITGPITITASAYGLSSTTSTIQAVIAGVPAQLAASLSADSFQEGSNGVTLNLQAEDAEGAPVDYTSPVSVVVTKSGSTTPATNILINGTPSIASTEISLNSSGNQAITLADSGNGGNAGTYTVTIAPVAGAAYAFPTQTLTFTETAASLDRVAFPSPSTTLTVPLTNPTATYTLQLEDSYGNPLDQGGVQVQVYAVGSSTDNSSYGEATVNGTVTTPSTPITVTTNTEGQATINLAAEAYNGASWVLYAMVPAQSSVASALESPPSAAMQVSTQVASALSLGLEDVTAGADYQSAGYAIAGDTVDATVTMKNQYGVPITGSQSVQLTIPAGLSGLEPPGASDSSPWVQGGTNTVTVTVSLNAAGQAVIPLEAWAEGSTTLAASIPGLTTPVTSSANLFVEPGPSTGVGLFNNGKAITTLSPLAVTANSPVAVTVQATDLAGNPVASSNNQVIGLNGGNGGSFRTTPTGAPISTITIPAGQVSVTVYYVNGGSGSYVPDATLDAYRIALNGPSTYSVSPGASQTLTATVYDESGNPVVGQTVTASVPNNEGTITPSTVSSANGTITFNYTAPAAGSGAASITLTVPGIGSSGSTLTVPVTINY